MDLIYGKNPVREALRAKKPLDKIYIATGSKTQGIQPILEMAKKRNIPIRDVDRKKLIELVGHENHQGIVATLSAVEYSSIDDVLERAKERDEKPLIAILDEVQDPHNLGAIIRSAEALGFHGIIISKNRSAGLSQTVAKTSAGASSHIPVVRVTNTVHMIEQLKDDGLWIAGADQDARETVENLDASMPVAIVIGGEEKGIRRLVKEKCDYLVRIPMHGHINSLNASVAAAIMFWEVTKKRNRAV
ncbi:MAG: 23S rRNA (guanosine(2251)-2'-O)-methyltransferase RlmB [candidate division KSB1 bacterium]|jgi:23S rRNA (guanosine2251-2'-O)-methyltransferase|nr:23S rRNA (guanosine(2251)-2'-O)-methyltransferase RlmB [candidate division KSB1 bacterium]